MLNKRFFLLMALAFVGGLVFLTSVYAATDNKDRSEDHVCTISTTPSEIPSGFPSPTETETPTPEVTDSPSTPPSSHGDGIGQSDSVAVAPAPATCNIPFSAPVLTTITPEGKGILSVHWLESDQNITDFGINYGFVGQPLSMGVPHLPSDARAYSIALLPVGSQVNAQVCAYKNGCGECSDIVDPLVQ